MMARTTQTELVLLRHGPTDWNAEGRIQGRSDPVGGLAITEHRAHCEQVFRFVRRDGLGPRPRLVDLAGSRR